MWGYQHGIGGVQLWDWGCREMWGVDIGFGVFNSRIWVQEDSHGIGAVGGGGTDVRFGVCSCGIGLHREV